MAVYSKGFTFKVGDGASPEVFTAMNLLEIPEVFASGKQTYPNATTGTAGNTPTVGVGFDAEETMQLVCEQDFANTQQDRLRTVYGSGADVNLQFLFADGTTTQTNEAAFKVTAQAVAGTDPNGDGATVRQTWTVRRNSDWTTAEA